MPPLKNVSRPMPPTIHLEAHHRAIVEKILREHLPENATVWVFGSRATGQRIWRGSDLDLAIDVGEKLPRTLESQLQWAFECSDLPWEVDVVDMHSLKDGIFRSNVERERVRLDWRENHSP